MMSAPAAPESQWFDILTGTVAEEVQRAVDIVKVFLQPVKQILPPTLGGSPEVPSLERTSLLSISWSASARFRLKAAKFSKSSGRCVAIS
jgi:hypothetical protein